MNTEDHYESVVTIILNPQDCHMMDNVLAVLRNAEMTIDNVDLENGAIEATGPSQTVRELEHVHLFEYIRTNFSYWKHLPRETSKYEGEAA